VAIVIKLLSVEHRVNAALIDSRWLPDWCVRAWGRWRCAVGVAAYRSGLIGGISPNRIIATYLKAGDVFVDVGSADGEMCCIALGAIGHSGRVYGFDGRVEAVDFSRKMFDRFGVLKQVEVHQRLVGAEPGVSEFIVDMAHPTSSSRLRDWVIAGGSMELARTIEVAVVSLNDWASETNLDRLDLIKIDVEGSELDVVRGAGLVLSAYRPMIVMEVSHPVGYTARPQALAGLADALESVGYSSFYQISTNGLEQVRSLRALDAGVHDIVAADLGKERHVALINRLMTRAS
jgi:FkbM family methyltransferase